MVLKVDEFLSKFQIIFMQWIRYRSPSTWSYLHCYTCWVYYSDYNHCPCQGGFRAVESASKCIKVWIYGETHINDVDSLIQPQPVPPPLQHLHRPYKGLQHYPLLKGIALKLRRGDSFWFETPKSTCFFVYRTIIKHQEHLRPCYKLVPSSTLILSKLVLKRIWLRQRLHVESDGHMVLKMVLFGVFAWNRWKWSVKVNVGPPPRSRPS